jgi:hypothetical protein
MQTFKRMMITLILHQGNNIPDHTYENMDTNELQMVETGASIFCPPNYDLLFRDAVVVITKTLNTTTVNSIAITYI